MATVHPPAKTAKMPYVPAVSTEELARGNEELLALLNSWVTEGDENEQRETLAILKEALGEGRVASSRNLFP